ncbi:helix-turn-helix transcriptional regulator [Paenibacillus thermotolerans]|uniref:helix-turn-helix transcriptional regulator n=1 Tax=Paenibacillus thermotolerans TaxID=3027807 RepID=UPI002367CCCC|nr:MULTISPECIES: helix-turn-helix transcriptional regulator [unclassified Paenibacillus]
MTTEQNWLINLRNTKDLTQEQVADLAEIKRPYYSMIESGKRLPSVKVAKRLGEILEFNWTIFFAKIGNDSLPNGKETTTSA